MITILRYQGNNSILYIKNKLYINRRVISLLFQKYKKGIRKHNCMSNTHIIKNINNTHFKF